MRQSAIGLSACVILLQACMQSVEFDVCRSQVDEGFLISLSDELKHREIKHNLKGGKLCFKNEDKFDVDRAASFVSSYRQGVVVLLEDIATEKRILEWLTTERKQYEITKTTDGRRLLIVHSESKEDEKSNREILTRLEKGE